MTLSPEAGARAHPGGHILLELGFEVRKVGDEIHGSVPIAPEVLVPGTASVRTSVLAAWADTATGYLAVGALAPRPPVTLSLDVHLHRPAPGTGAVHAVARMSKAGKTVVVLGVDFLTDDGEPLGLGTASFMAVPDSGLALDIDVTDLEGRLAGGPLLLPLAERARCTREAPGRAVLARADDGLNAVGSVNGGLVALAAEEAALSATPGTTLSTLAVRYLRPVRTGPAVATAEVRSGLGRVEVRDAGRDNALAVTATTRTF